MGKFQRVPTRNIVVQEGPRGKWRASVYNMNGHLQSGITVPSDLEYIKAKMEEWFPGIPIEYFGMMSKRS